MIDWVSVISLCVNNEASMFRYRPAWVEIFDHGDVVSIYTG